MKTGPLSAYLALREHSNLQEDALQEAAAKQLQTLHDRLSKQTSNKNNYDWKSWFGLNRQSLLAPKGLYIYGPAGRGKSMLMDLFFKNVCIDKKRRVHFHEFMISTHDTLHTWRQTIGKSENESDPLHHLANEIAGKSTLLCFDEFHVANIADAMILGRLFEGIFNAGGIIVATSNFAPDDLYMNGLQRERFLPFIDLLKEKMAVFELSSPTDYRQARLSRMRVYHTPLGDDSDHALERAFFDLTEGAIVEEDTLLVKGRKIPIAKSARGVAYFKFEELCQQPLGAEDYIALGNRYHTIILKNIPQMSEEMRNEAKRFMNLIDVLYEKNVNLVVSADCTPDMIYTSGAHTFEFQRTISRLIEMQSPQYIELTHLSPSK